MLLLICMCHKCIVKCLDIQIFYEQKIAHFLIIYPFINILSTLKYEKKKFNVEVIEYTSVVWYR